MYFERLLVGNVRPLGHREHDFAIGPGRLRRWNLFPAGSSSSALLRALALAGLGQRQLEKLAQQSPLNLAEHSDQPVHIEFVQLLHAPQERGSASPVRRHLGWWGGEGGQFSAMPKSAMRRRDPAARAGRPDLGRSNVGRLLLGYGSQVRAQTGTDCFDIHPDQRLKRCANLFDSEAQVTDPVAFLERLRHKSQYRAGRARALLARLSADLSDWLGWDVGGSLGREGAFEARWQATRASLRRPAIVALDMARLFSTPPRAWTTPTRSSNRAWSSWTARTPGAKPADKHSSSSCWMPGFRGSSSSSRFHRQGGAAFRPGCWSKASPFQSRSHAAGLLRTGGCHRGRYCWWTWTARCRTWR